MIQIKNFTFNPFQENTLVLFDETKECVIIDPGCYENHEEDILSKFIEDNDLKVVQLLNTHCHIDHVLGNAFVKRKYGVDLVMHKIDEATLASVEVYAGSYGFAQYQPSTANKFVDEGDTIRFGNSELEILFVPGHAPGHIAFVNQEQNICIGGDVLFDGSIGRTDLPGGDFNTLIDSIHNKIFPLGEYMVVYPGHGPTTTVGKEMKSNPFCAIR